MAVFTKEKNIIKFGENEKKLYTYDINTGELIGLKGNVLVRFPNSIDGEFITENFGLESKYERQMLFILYNDYHNSRKRKVSDITLFVDKYYAIKDIIPFKDTSSVRYVYNKVSNDTEAFFKDLKNLMKFAKENDYQTISHILYDTYIRQKAANKYEEYFKNTNFTNEQKQYLLDKIISFANKYKTPPKVLKNMIKWVSHPSAWEFGNVVHNTWSGAQGSYIENPNYDKLPRYTNEMLRDICYAYLYNPELTTVPDVKTVYEAHLQIHRLIASIIAEREKKKIEEYFTLAKKYHYENDDFIMLLPTTAKELEAEGKAQSNCVGGYLSHMKNKNKIVVFIRDRHNPNKSLVTCDLYVHTPFKKYMLNWYLLSHNYEVQIPMPSSDTYNTNVSIEMREKLLKFKEEFAKHIDKINNM